ncbi:uncharacterized protein LOC116114486 [Pistacia vera]|uniref:uncharacterized protein LOC116114486 n=1 Tax=Pistacia vera TaxID=55513 RepID=UPI00126337E7|nr:uncharacterized protein LOC116114486 [Pistacia vera]
MNNVGKRKELWKELIHHANVSHCEPWGIIGDFNVVRFAGEKKGGSNQWNSQCEEFNDMCKEADIDDLNSIGSFFTWNNRGELNRRIWCKLDKVMCNEHWSNRFPNSFTSFLTPGILDHCSMVVDSGLNFQGKKSPFKFFNFWAEHEDFLPMVEREWSVQVEGNPMYRLVSKLKALKVELKRLNRKEFWNISERVKFARDDLAHVQERLVVDPIDGALLQEEKVKVENMVKLSKAEESLAKQKSRVKWLRERDANTSYFFKSIAGWRNRNKIVSLEIGEDSVTSDQDRIKEEFVSFYSNLFKEKCAGVSYEGMEELITPVILEEEANSMICEVSKEEIQEIMFGMSKDKAPGLDGYDVVKAIQNFFKSGKMLRKVNCAIIALVPKNENPSSCSEFRLISCRNTIYKCISKIMANRVKRVLLQFVNKAQGAFVGGRKIMDNILLSQELLHHYDRKSAKGARCAMKVDLMKAYYSVRWDFVIKAPELLGFPLKFIGWVEE